MTKIKDLIKHKKKGITLEEDPKLLRQKVVSILRITVPEQMKPEAPKKAKTPPSPLQLLGNQRNWDILKIKGAIGDLERLRNSLSSVTTFQYVYQNGLQVIRDELIKAVNLKWEQDKRAYLQRVEEEAFAAYPRSFRGSPAEINKRLDIMKAQEEF